MGVLNILMTDPSVEEIDDFVHGDIRFVFDHLGQSGPRKLLDGPTWAFVNWVLDDLAGLEMCRRLRADPRTRSAHITMVLEENDAEDRRRALKAGADDYMIGPLTRNQVLDRVMSIDPAQSQRKASQMFEIGSLSINKTAVLARWDGKAVALPPNEFRLLCFLAENPDRVLSRAEVIAGLGKDAGLDERTVDVWIGRLRRALHEAGAGAANPLRTVRSHGYVFHAPDP